MPAIVLLFRQAAWARGGHLGGNCRERQPVFNKLRFLVTVTERAGEPCGFLTVRQRDRDGSQAPVDACASPQRFDPAHGEASTKGPICSACRRRAARRIIVLTMKTACG